MSVREQLNAIAARRVLVLDGAMGSMLQQLKLTEADFRAERFAGHSTPLAGCNDMLCLTRPNAVRAIHEAYLAAGADIIETCSFNATAVSLADYGLGEQSYEISAAAAALARKAADSFSAANKPRFVAGSIGPTGKSAGLSPDVTNPGRRGIYWDELEAAFYDCARGLLDGGADILLLETFFDTLNAKAALFAVGRLMAERSIDIPVMISATVTGDSGRLLAGQILEAFCVSVLHAKPWAIGLNCSFGAEKLLAPIRSLAAIAPCLISVHPNAGLPNQFGGYDESPAAMAAHLEPYLREGLLNIAGGCCGTTPAHIAAIAEKAAAYQPRVMAAVKGGSRQRPFQAAGLELLRTDTSGEKSVTELPLTLIGERTNVAGSRKFLRLISAQKYDEAAAFARGVIDDGADIICVGMDDAMLDAEQSMCAFLDRALADPDIARVPVMLDSSRWNVIEAGLKRLQGKGMVNSINLKDGEAELLRRASLIGRYGAAAVVMLIDEKGQAVNYDRKIAIAGRAWRLLVHNGFPAENIIFDPNVLAVATGIGEHDACALDFIRTCAWIRTNCPGVQISGGISNLSYSFRGNNTVREAMHSVFLHHACAAGLSMAIVNPAAFIAYNDIEPKLRNAVEDVILNRGPGAADTLIALAEQISVSGSGSSSSQTITHNAPDWRKRPVEERIVHAMVKGLDEYIEADVLALKGPSEGESGGRTALEIVEGPLMDGMKTVGQLFNEGKMYLPQVIRSARVMKKAAAALEPYMRQSNTNTNSNTAPVIVLATVKGDVHDIGKNIVGVVLACNGCRIIDLGVMVPAEQILAAAEKEHAAAIGLSGLISPSLDEMANIAREMEKRQMTIPLLIGGAAASLVHTGLRLAPEYSGPVVYVPNAGKSAETVRALLSVSGRSRFLQNLAEEYQTAARQHAVIQNRIEIMPLAAARANRVPSGGASMTPNVTGIIELNDYPVERVIPYINWRTVTDTFEKDSAIIANDARALLERAASEGLLTLRGTIGIFPAAADGDDIVINNKYRLCFLRNQHKKPEGMFNACLADFTAPAVNGTAVDRLGLFALSAGFGLETAANEFRRRHDDYSALLLAALANALAEAFTEEVHTRVRREWWGYAADETLTAAAILKGGYTGIRPAFGYPACPDHEDKRIAFTLLEAEERCGLRLTDSAMIMPAASICGMFFANPNARYFGVGTIGEDQLIDWAERKGISRSEAERRIGGLAE